MIYVLESGDYFKVGYSKNLKRRLSEYRTHNPSITLLGVYEGGKSDEKILHEMFKDHRLPGTEWFVKYEGFKNHLTNLTPKNEYKGGSYSVAGERFGEWIYKTKYLSDFKLMLGIMEHYSKAGFVWDKTSKELLSNVTGVSINNLSKNLKRLIDSGVIFRRGSILYITKDFMEFPRLL